jgi:hypothetical protein
MNVSIIGIDIEPCDVTNGIASFIDRLAHELHSTTTRPNRCRVIADVRRSTVH